jgi:hypothetical protein
VAIKPIPAALPLSSFGMVRKDHDRISKISLMATNCDDKAHREYVISLIKGEHEDKSRDTEEPLIR